MTSEKLRSLLHYDHETGTFTWNAREADCEAGYFSGSQIMIAIDGEIHVASRLAWLYMTGRWPKDQIDHIDRNPSNNRWCNLREATHAQNMKNRKLHKSNTSGYIGVSRHGRFWRVQLTTDGVRERVNGIESSVVASWIRDIMAIKQHDEFASLNHPEWLECFHEEDHYDEIRDQ